MRWLIYFLLFYSPSDRGIFTILFYVEKLSEKKIEYDFHLIYAWMDG